MSVAESDLELLELQLDGALDEAQARELSRRLTAEPSLAAASARLQTERATRQQLFLALEPSEQAVEQFAWRIAGAAAEHRCAERHQQQHSRRIDPWRMTRWGTAAAACLLFGFVAGRGTRPLTIGAPGVQPGMGPAATVADVTADPAQPAVRTAGLTPMVPVTNEYGQVVAWQPFHNTEEAQHFAEDLNRVRLPMQAPLGDSVKLASEEKF